MSKWPKSGGASLRPCRNGLSQEEPLAAWRQVLDGMPAWRQVLRWHGPETPDRRFGSIWINFDHFGPVRTFPDLCVETYFLGCTPWEISFLASQRKWSILSRPGIIDFIDLDAWRGLGSHPRRPEAPGPWGPGPEGSHDLGYFVDRGGRVVLLT